MVATLDRAPDLELTDPGFDWRAPKLETETLQGQVEYGGFRDKLYNLPGASKTGGVLLLAAGGWTDPNSVTVDPVMRAAVQHAGAIMPDIEVTAGVIQHMRPGPFDRSRKKGLLNDPLLQRSLDIKAGMHEAITHRKPALTVMVLHSLSAIDGTTAIASELDAWQATRLAIVRVDGAAINGPLGEQRHPNIWAASSTIYSFATDMAKSLRYVVDYMRDPPSPVEGEVMKREHEQMMEVDISEESQRIRDAGIFMLDIFHRSDRAVRPPEFASQHTLVVKGDHLQIYESPREHAALLLSRVVMPMMSRVTAAAA